MRNIWAHFATLIIAIAFLSLEPAALADPPITAAALTPDAEQVLLASQAGVEIRSWPQLNLAERLPSQLDNIHDLKFSPDGKTLLIAGGSPAEAGIVKVIEWPTRKMLRQMSDHSDVVYQVAWSPDGTQWASAGSDGICRVYSQPSGDQLIAFEGHSQAVLSLCFLPDGKSVASVGVDQTVRLWDSMSGKLIRTLDNHVNIVNAIATRPQKDNASPAAVATISEDLTVRFWQPSIGRLMRFTKLATAPRAIAWSASGDRLFVGSNDGHIRTISADTAEILNDQACLNGRIHDLVLDPHSDRILAVGAGGYGIVNLSAGSSP